MRFFFTERFRTSYADAPAAVQRQCDKQLSYLARDLRHPSLKTKKFDEVRGIWQARVNRSWRFYFLISAGTYTLLDIIPHPK
jgi:hypothetical protein